MRENSLSFAVTSVRSSARACAANQQIVAADRQSRALEVRSDLCVRDVGWSFERSNIESLEDCRQLGRQSPRVRFCDTVLQFRDNNDARTDLRLGLRNPIGHAPAGIAHQV